jgi:glycosyltransferase involved in cell wall biosynthesis
MRRSSVKTWRDFLQDAEEPVVVHLPRNLGGNTSLLSKAMRDIGISSISICFEEDRFGFQPDVTICSPNDSLITKELRRIAWIFRILRNADILHFNSGTTLAMPSDRTARTPDRDSLLWRGLRHAHARYSDCLQILELRVARILKKRMYMTFQGDDIRQGDSSLARFEISIAQHVGPDYYNPVSDQRKRRLLSRYRSHNIQFFILNPDLNSFLDGAGAFIPYSNAIVKRATVGTIPHRGRVLRIVHAPSHRLAKGTARIMRTLSELQDLGFKFEFEIIENLSNVEARHRIARADLLIDQLFAGWYGGVSVEAMAVGVPVMSYIREDDLIYIPRLMRNDLPVINVSPSNLASRIEWFLGLSEDDRRQLSERCINYAHRWHSPDSVAEYVRDKYRLCLKD